MRLATPEYRRRDEEVLRLQTSGADELQPRSAHEKQVGVEGRKTFLGTIHETAARRHIREPRATHSVLVE